MDLAHDIIITSTQSSQLEWLDNDGFHSINDVEHIDFTEEVALQCLLNDLDEEGVDTRVGGSPEKRKETHSADLAHDIRLISAHPHYCRGSITMNGKQKKPMFRCAHCSNMATQYCLTCTSALPKDSKSKIVAVCSVQSQRGSACINAHFM